MRLFVLGKMSVPPDEELYNNVRTGDRRAINFTLTKSPDADQGCRARLVTLLLYASILENRDDISSEVNSLCNAFFGESRDFISRLSQIAKGMPSGNLMLSGPSLRELLSFNSPLLIEKLLSMNILDPSDILREVSGSGNMNVVEFLLNSYPNIRPEDILNAALFSRDVGTVMILVQRLAPQDIQAILDRAVSAGNNNLVMSLVQRYPDLELQDAFDLAIKSGDIELIDLLLDINPELDFEKGLQDLINSRYADMFKEITSRYEITMNLQDLLNEAVSQNNNIRINTLLTIDPNLDVEEAAGYSSKNETTSYLRNVAQGVRGS